MPAGQVEARLETRGADPILERTAGLTDRKVRTSVRTFVRLSGPMGCLGCRTSTWFQGFIVLLFS